MADSIEDVFEGKSDEEIVGMDPERRKDGSSRLLSETMAIYDRKRQIQVRLQQATCATTSRRAAPEASEASAEELIDSLIEQMETSFLQFEQRLRALAGHMELPPYLDQDNFYSPFLAVNLNRENEQRNMIRRGRQIRSGETSSINTMRNPYHFFYDLKKGHGGMATFNPVYRILALPPDHNPKSLVHQLVEYHEMRHANQDANKRLSLMHDPLAMEEYLDFYRKKGAGRPCVMVTEEATAYGYQMEAFNILLQGKLQKTPLPTPDQVIRELECSEADRAAIEMFLAIAEQYFPEGMQGGVFSQRFIDCIRDAHIGMGYDVYVMMTNGERKQMQRGQR